MVCSTFLPPVPCSVLNSLGRTLDVLAPSPQNKPGSGHNYLYVDQTQTSQALVPTIRPIWFLSKKGKNRIDRNLLSSTFWERPQILISDKLTEHQVTSRDPCIYILGWLCPATPLLTS